MLFFFPLIFSFLYLRLSIYLSIIYIPFFYLSFDLEMHNLFFLMYQKESDIEFKGAFDFFFFFFFFFFFSLLNAPLPLCFLLFFLFYLQMVKIITCNNK